MPHSIEKHPTLPLIIRHYSAEDLSLTETDSPIIRETNALFEAQPNKVYYLIDVSDLHLNIEEIMKAGNLAAQKSSTIHNDKIIETLIVVASRLAELAAQGLRTASFGHLQVRPFRSIQDAVAYVEQQTANS